MENVSIETKSNKKIFAGTALGYVNFFLHILSGLILTPWIISKLGDSQYGIYTLCFSMINMFLFDFGLTTTTNTYLSKLRAKGDEEGIKRFTSLVFKIYLVLDLIVALLFVGAFFLIDVMYTGLTIAEKHDLKICFIIVALFNLISLPSTLFTGALYSHEKFAFLRIADIVNKVLSIILTIICLSLGWGLYSLVIVYAISGLVAIIMKVLEYRLGLKEKIVFRCPIDKVFLKNVLSFSVWSMLLSICSRLVFNVTPSILGITSNSNEIAIFGVVTVIEGYVYSFGSMVGGLFLPKLSRLLKEKDGREKLQAFINKVGKVQSIIITIIIVGFFSVGKDFLTLWLDGNPLYDSAFLGILLICSYQLINIPQSIITDVMYYDETIRPLAISSITKAIINTGLAFLFSYYYGALGACVAVAVSRLIELILYNISYKKFVKISLTSFFKEAIIPVLVVSLPIAIFCFKLSDLFMIENLVARILVNGFTCVILYCAAIYIFILNKDEKNRIITIIKKRKIHE